MKAYALFKNGEFYNKTKSSGLYETLKGARLGITWTCDRSIKYDSRYYLSDPDNRNKVYAELMKEYSSQFKIKELLEGDYIE